MQFCIAHNTVICLFSVTPLLLWKELNVKYKHVPYMYKQYRQIFRFFYPLPTKWGLCSKVVIWLKIPPYQLSIWFMDAPMGRDTNLGLDGWTDKLISSNLWHLTFVCIKISKNVSCLGKSISQNYGKCCLLSSVYRLLL